MGLVAPGGEEAGAAEKGKGSQKNRYNHSLSVGELGGDSKVARLCGCLECWPHPPGEDAELKGVCSPQMGRKGLPCLAPAEDLLHTGPLPLL